MSIRSCPWALLRAGAPHAGPGAPRSPSAHPAAQLLLGNASHRVWGSAPGAPAVHPPVRPLPQNTRMPQEGAQGSGGRLQPPSSAPGPCKARSGWPGGHVPGILLPRFAGEKNEIFIQILKESRLNPRPLRPGLCSARERRAAGSSQLRGTHTAAGTTGHVGLQPGKKKQETRSETREKCPPGTRLEQDQPSPLWVNHFGQNKVNTGGGFLGRAQGQTPKGCNLHGSSTAFGSQVADRQTDRRTPTA